MAHEVETMAWAHKVPWHGLGVQVGSNTTPEEMLVKAGLDWEVAKLPIWTTYGAPTDFQPENGGSFMPGELQQVRGKAALTRVSDGKVFDVVGDRWKPVQNRDALAFFKTFCDEGGAEMETAGALKGGQIVWALCNLKAGFTLPDGDAVKGYLLLASKHEAGFATIARITPIRVVCANTFAMSGGFKAAAQVRIPHTMEFRPDEAAAQVGIAREGMHEFERNARVLSRLNISRDDARRILIPVFQPQEDVKEVMKDFDNRGSRTVKAIMEAALKGPGTAGTDVSGTAWGIFQGCTYYANHGARGTADNRFASTLVGQNNITTNKVFSRLLLMADAD